MFKLNFTTILLTLAVFTLQNIFFIHCQLITIKETGQKEAALAFNNFGIIQNWDSCYDTYIGQEILESSNQLITKIPAAGTVGKSSGRPELIADANGNFIQVPLNLPGSSLTANIHNKNNLDLENAYEIKVFLYHFAIQQLNPANYGTAGIFVQIKRQASCNEDPNVIELLKTMKEMNADLNVIYNTAAKEATLAQVRNDLNEFNIQVMNNGKDIKEIKKDVKDAVNGIDQKNIMGYIIATYDLIRNSSVQACTSTSCCFPPYICSSFYQQGGK